jgi:hypothetical protein
VIAVLIQAAHRDQNQLCWSARGFLKPADLSAQVKLLTGGAIKAPVDQIARYVMRLRNELDAVHQSTPRGGRWAERFLEHSDRFGYRLSTDASRLHLSFLRIVPREPPPEPKQERPGNDPEIVN